MLFLLGSTLLGYSTENLLVLLAAWILTTVPFFPAAVVPCAVAPAARPVPFQPRPRAGHWRSLRQTATPCRSIELKGQSPGGMAVFWAPGGCGDFSQRNLPCARLGGGCRGRRSRDSHRSSAEWPFRRAAGGKVDCAAVSAYSPQSFPGAFVSRPGHRALRRHPGADGEFASPAARLPRAQPVGVHSGRTGEPDCGRNHRRAGSLVRGDGLHHGTVRMSCDCWRFVSARI